MVQYLEDVTLRNHPKRPQGVCSASSNQKSSRKAYDMWRRSRRGCNTQKWHDAALEDGDNMINLNAKNRSSTRGGNLTWKVVQNISDPCTNHHTARSTTTGTKKKYMYTYMIYIYIYMYIYIIYIYEYTFICNGVPKAMRSYENDVTIQFIFGNLGWPLMYICTNMNRIM